MTTHFPKDKRFESVIISAQNEEANATNILTAEYINYVIVKKIKLHGSNNLSDF